MDDLISRQAAIDAVARVMVIKSRGGRGNRIAEAVDSAKIIIVDNILQLPPIQPVIAPCDYAKACNEATMDKLTSAVAYYDALEELRKHGYVLVDMREVNHESN